MGNVEFLARTADTPRFTFGIIEIAAGRELEAHVHSDEDDAFYIVEGEMTFAFGDEEVAAPPGTFVLVPPGGRTGGSAWGTDRQSASSLVLIEPLPLAQQPRPCSVRDPSKGTGPS